MTTKLNLNQSPYFDDYDKTKKYYQILFRPGRAVQARELTQLQTILQQQIERFGTHVFKQGANVIPGTDNTVRFVRDIPFIKVPLSDLKLGLYQDQTLTYERLLDTYWLNKTVACTTDGRQGIKAKIVGYRIDNINGGEVRLFLVSKSSSNSGTDSFFRPSDTVQRISDETGAIETDPRFFLQIPNEATKVGLVSSVTVQEGVYFYNGFFIYVEPQTIFLSPSVIGQQSPDDLQNQSRWNNNPTATVGLKITESTKTYQLNRDLLDNATGTPNQSAPGADRLHIDAQLIQTDYAVGQEPPADFIKLLDVVKGEVKFVVNKTDYNVLVDTLARRTFDESGDYVVNDFVVHVKNFLRDEETEQDGVHDIKEFAFSTQAAAKEYSIKKFKHLLTTTQITNGGVAIKHPNDATGFWYPGTSYDSLGDKTSFKNLCDAFLSLRIDPGKAYVKGYEIQKLGRTTVDVPKSRSTKFVNNNITTTSVGPYFTVTDLITTTNFETIQTIGLYKKRIGSLSDSDKIGTAKLICVESAELPGEFRAHITDVKMLNGAEIYETKSLFSTSDPQFSANVVLTEVALTGSVSFQTGNTSITGTGTRWKSNTQEQLKTNDYVRIGNNSTYFRVSENPSTDTLLVLDPMPATEFSGETIFYSYAVLNTDQPSGLLFSLPHEYISTIRTADENGDVSENTDILYSIPTFILNNSGGYYAVSGGVCDVSFPGGASSSEDRFDLISDVYKIISDTGKWFIPAAGTGEPTSADVVNIEITTSGNLKLRFKVATAPASVQVIAPIVRNSRKEKRKTLTSGFVVADQAANSEINLNQYDVFRITKIVTSTSPGVEPNPTTDKRIEALYDLDTGQRDFFYDLARVTLKAGYEKPEGKVRVEFEYFEHSEEGDYFSVDSYSSYFSGLGEFNPGISYGEIPNYTSSDGISYALTDCLDFRKKLNASTAGKAPIQRIVCDYHFYRARSDKLILSSKTQNFELSLGIPDLVPQPASDLAEGMTICELLHNPFGISRESCVLKYLDNRRYTMRDIGKLEKRIKNLEYYTTLSLLEKETSDLVITDANGNDRFKNGFLVDNFSSFDSSDISSPDFLCSIDAATERVARPMINDDYIELFETLSPNVGAVSSEEAADARVQVGHYTETNGLYTLPYTKSVFISQGIASKVSNINPFNVSTYIGELKLTPWSDSWRETKTLEPIVIKDEAAYTQALNNINGKIDYSAPFEVFSDTTISDPQKVYGKQNQKILVAGHDFLEEIRAKNRKAYEKIKSTGKFKVPEPYINAGQLVPIGRNTQYQQRYAQKTTTTTKTIRTGLENSVVDLGFSETRSLTKSELTEVQFIRSREISFSGTAFKPNSNLYAFFDNIPVSEDCRPVIDGANGWDQYKIIDAYSVLALDPSNALVSGISKLTSDAKTKIFKILSGSPFNTTQIAGRTDLVGVVRPGCEVRYTTKSGITKKFEVLTVSLTGDRITCVQKDDAGLISELSAGLEPSDIASLANQLAGYNIEVSKHTFGDQLQADGAGRVAGTFKIPNKEAKRFKTGDVTFTLSSSNVSGTSASTSASARYTARGLLNTEQQTITQTRQFAVSASTVDPDVNISVENGDPIYGFGPVVKRDPIAQSFTVTESGGCFITDVEVFFAKKPAQNDAQVLLELRTVNEAGPQAIIVGGDLGKVSAKKNEDIVVNKVTYETSSGTNGASNKSLTVVVDVDADGEPLGNVGAKTRTENGETVVYWDQSSDIKPNGTIAEVLANTNYVNSEKMSEQMIPTRFTFDAPIYLEENKTYCFVLLSGSDEYEVWVAQRGRLTGVDSNIGEYKYYSKEGEPNVKIGTTTSIDGEKLYAEGNFFRGKDGFNWQIDPSVSVKFNLFKAKFDTTSTGVVNFVNEELPETRLFSGGIQAKAGSNKLRVTVPNHGFMVGEFVKFAIVAEDAALLGINREVFDAPLLITRTEIDQFIVQLPSVASTTGRILGTISAKINKRFEQAILTTNSFVPNKDASIVYGIQTTPTSGVHQLDENGNALALDNKKLLSRSIVPAVSIEFESPMKVNTPLNEDNTITILGGPSGSVGSAEERQNRLLNRKSVVVSATLSSTNENLSPVLDASRIGLALISTRLDKPTGAAVGLNDKTVINDEFDTVVVFDSAVVGTTTIADKLSFSAATEPIAGKATQPEFSNVITIHVIDVGDPAIDITKDLKIGDKVFDVATNQERTVIEIINNTQFKVDSPFNPSLQSEFVGSVEIPKRLYTTARYMEITTTNIDIAKSLSQLDIGKLVSMSLTDNTTNTLIENTKITFDDAVVLDVDYTPDASGSSPKCAVVVKHINSGVAGTALSLSGLSDANDLHVTLIQKDRFIDEIAPSGGSAATKYISKKLNLDATCNALKVIFDAVRDPSCDIVLYYRTEQPNDQVRAFEKNWIKADFNVELNGALVNKTPDADPENFKVYESTLNGLPSFTGVQVKIVMLGGNPAKPPKIKNLQVIALDE